MLDMLDSRSVHSVMWRDSGFILKVMQVRYANGLMVKYERSQEWV